MISQVLIDVDAQAVNGEDITDTIGRYVDLDSLSYAATQRVKRLAQTADAALPASMLALLAGAWLDAFVAGVRYQHLKQTQAQTLTQEDMPPGPAAQRDQAGRALFTFTDKHADALRHFSLPAGERDAKAVGKVVTTDLQDAGWITWQKRGQGTELCLTKPGEAMLRRHAGPVT